MAIPATSEAQLRRLEKGLGDTASDYLVDRMYKWGVRRVFGYPGDGINGVMEALNRSKGMIEFIQTRHEEVAAFMACAHAKFTGEVGVCIATSGPGAIHLLNGLYDAKMDHQPVVAIIGQSATTAIGSDYQQEVDLISLFKDVAHEFVYMASTPAQIRQLVDRAFRIAIAERTVTCIIIPNDVQEMEATEPERKHGSTFTGYDFRTPKVIPKDEDLKAAADILNSGRKVAMLVGAGALGATDEVMQAAELLGAGVAKALLGKAVLPDDLPYVTGSIGLLGTKPSYDLMMECDTFLMIGSGFPYAEFLPKEGQARGVQIDINPRMLGLRYPFDVCMQGDSAITLKALMPMLRRKQERGWRAAVERAVGEWWAVMEARAMLKANPINPQLLLWDLSSRLPDNCMIACDTGTVTNWYARDIKIRRGMMAAVSGNLSTMGHGMPYALAAKFAHPDRPVVCLAGDGAMQMLGMNEVIDVARHWREWSNPAFIVLVLNNEDLNMVTWEQRVMNGDPKFPASQDISDFPYAQYAKSLGLKGIEVGRPKDVPHAWNEAFKSDRPVIIEAHTDPDVPPLPPHITFEQAKGFMFSIFKGDPNKFGIMKQSAKQMMGTFLTRLK
jgi:pyruvate dehydrogenase (quinone)